MNQKKKHKVINEIDNLIIHVMKDITKHVEETSKPFVTISVEEKLDALRAIIEYHLKKNL